MIDCVCTPDGANQPDSYCPMHGCPHTSAAHCNCTAIRRLAESYNYSTVEPDGEVEDRVERERDSDWFCNTARDIIGGGGQRRQDYGSVEESFEAIAVMWSVVLHTDVTAEQVALCQALLKMGRLLNTPGHTDSWVDIIGYAALGGQIAHQPNRH